MSFTVPRASPYIVPTREPDRPKHTERIEQVHAVVATRATAKGAEGDSARVHISEQARELAQRHLAEHDLAERDELA